MKCYSVKVKIGETTNSYWSTSSYKSLYKAGVSLIRSGARNGCCVRYVIRDYESGALYARLYCHWSETKRLWIARLSSGGNGGKHGLTYRELRGC